MNKPIMPLEPELTIKPRQIWLSAIACVLILASIFLYNQRTGTSTDNQTAPVVTTVNNQYLTAGNRVVCGNATVGVVLCENVSTHEIRRYNLPKEIGNASSISSSPDNKRFVVTASVNYISDASISQKFYILDGNFNVIKQLPSSIPSQDGYDFSWSNDSQSLIYSLRTSDGRQFGKSQLYRYDIDSGQTNRLTNLVDGAYQPQVTPNGYILAYSQTDDSSVKPEQLQAISPKDGSIVQTVEVSDSATDDSQKGAQKIAENGVDMYTRFAYNRDTNFLYGKATTGTNNGHTLVAALRPSPHHLRLAILKTYATGDIDGRIITDRGALVRSYSVGDNRYGITTDPSNLYQTTLKLTTDQASLQFTLRDWPRAKAAANNQLTANDYLYEYGTPPARLHEFAVKRLTEGCRPGQFRSVIVYAYDSDQQAAISEGSCDTNGTSAMVYYVYQNGTYQKIIATQEGVDCKQAAKYNLSKAVLPTCNDGLY